MKIDFSRVLAGLRPSQRRMFSPARTVMFEYSPQTGKTTAVIEWLKYWAFTEGKKGDIVFYALPVWKMSQLPFERLANSDPRLIAEVNKTNRQVLFRNGVQVKFVSTEHPQSIFGDTVSALVVDEASDHKDEAWSALFSRLAYTQGKIRICGNRRGRKRFYDMCRMAENEPTADLEFYKMDANLAVSEGIMAQSEFDLQKSLMPEILFRELYLLEDVSALNPFVGWEKCISDAPSLAETDMFGLDYARFQDYYALMGIDKGCHWTTKDVWQGLDSEVSANRTRDIVQKCEVLVDSTGNGAVHLDQLNKRGVRAAGFNFTATSRQALLENLARMISANDCRYPRSVGEQLSRFEYKETALGTKFACAETYHDDEAMAFALACWKHRTRREWNIF